MSYSLEFVKEVIEEFVKSNQNSSIDVSEKSMGSVSINRSIFEIESYLVRLRQECNINNRLDTSISSDNIFKHFKSISASDAFKSVDYQLNFLHHLAINFLPDIELVTLIDSFIEKYKKQFKLADIVITQSGATRCKTNIRFSVNSLRELGLVLSKGAEGKRSWAPSIMGLVTLLNIRFNIDEIHPTHEFKKFDSLLTYASKDRLSSWFTYDPTLMNSMRMFANPEHLYLFLHQLKDDSIKKDRDILEDIIGQYIDFVQEGLEITESGIKVTKLFKQKTDEFQQKLFSIEEANVDLHSKLFKQLRRKIN